MANCKNIFQFLLSFLISEGSFSYVILTDPGLQERPEKKEEYRSQEFRRNLVIASVTQEPGEPRRNHKVESVRQIGRKVTGLH